jgi:hypothetical protein
MLNRYIVGNTKPTRRAYKVKKIQAALSRAACFRCAMPITVLSLFAAKGIYTGMTEHSSHRCSCLLNPGQIHFQNLNLRFPMTAAKLLFLSQAVYEFRMWNLFFFFSWKFLPFGKMLY